MRQSTVDEMTDDPLHRFSAFVDLTPRERAAMRDMIGPVTPFDAGERIRWEGQEVAGLYFLHDGWALSSITHADGSRQVLKVHRAGDVMGAPSLPFEAAVESLVALTPSSVSTVPLSKLGALFAAHPRLGLLLFLGAQEERVALMDRLAVGGQLGAQRSVAALLLLIFEGRPSSDDLDTSLHIPLTQGQIGDVLGLSTIHVNRVVLALEREGLIQRNATKNRRNGHVYRIPDVPRLKELVGMPERVRRRDPSWLPPATP